ncbi:MAG: hypothetical protein ACYTAQ_09855 [Planctomycetota bacterium]|jgi:hypothetical protein
MRFMNCALAAVGLFSSSALAQSVNMDYHDAAGIPTADYAAAGLPGAWNALTGPAGVPESLVGLDGLAITATLTQTGGVGLQYVPNGALTGNDAALLNDRLLSTQSFITLDFAALTNGTYDVYTYVFGGTQPNVSGWLNDDQGTTFDYVTAWNGQLELGATHAWHQTQVLDGSLRITINLPGDDAVVNGVQLVLIPAPGALPLLVLAAGTGRRRRRG